MYLFLLTALQRKELSAGGRMCDFQQEYRLMVENGMRWKKRCVESEPFIIKIVKRMLQISQAFLFIEEFKN